MRCIAVDDEPLALRKLCDYVSRVPYLELAGQFSKPVQALAFIHQSGTDLLFLDIQMDLLTGIQLLESLHPRPYVIITTAYPQFALKGFDLAVTDYLLKPYNFERFIKATDRVWRRFTGRNEYNANTASQAGSSDYLFVKSGRLTECIRPSEIIYVEGMSEYLAIHLPGRKIITLLSFAKLEQLLPAGHFVRIHRSFLVPFEKIESIGQHVVRVGQRELPVGEKYRENFLKMISGWQSGG
jgi:DNA-binding LytR/AlgR family response regulator